jgi:hypothetical protein
MSEAISGSSYPRAKRDIRSRMSRPCGRAFGLLPDFHGAWRFSVRQTAAPRRNESSQSETDKGDNVQYWSKVGRQR